YRVVGAQAVDRAVPRMTRNRPDLRLESCATRHEPLPGGRGIHSEGDLDQWTTRTRDYLATDDHRARHLVERFGSRIQTMLPYIEPESASIAPHLRQTCR